jgi:hypothetical protein
LNVEKVIKLYLKEREYQKEAFGDYKEIGALSFPSFLIFLKRYTDRAIEAYMGPWEESGKRPYWLEHAHELDFGTVPSEAYANIIKIMALAGAALETYAEINVEEWRKDAKEDLKKWRYSHE